MSIETSWTDRVQGIGSIIASLGVIAACYFSVQSLHESRISRELATQPLLAFDASPHDFRVEILDDSLDNGDVLKLDGAKLFHLQGLNTSWTAQEAEPYGDLVNYGNGPALEVAVPFRQEDKADLRPGDEFYYGYPPVPSHL